CRPRTAMPVASAAAAPARMRSCFPAARSFPLRRKSGFTGSLADSCAARLRRRDAASRTGRFRAGGGATYHGPMTGSLPDFDTAFQDKLRDLMVWRRDVRHFRPDPVDPVLLQHLLEL